jgi:hypothetical protein
VDSSKSSASCARHARLVVHECGCFIENVTDKHGEYPLAVEGCPLNDKITEQLRSGELSDQAYLFAIKNHRGREIA